MSFFESVSLGRGRRPAGRRARSGAAAIALVAVLPMLWAGLPAQAAGQGPDAADPYSAGPDAVHRPDATLYASGTSGPIRPSTAVGTRDIPSGYPFWTLQLNLCNSGVADCYAGGRSIPEAYGVILNSGADLVTLNEVCRNDVETSLYPAIQQLWASDATFWAFMPAFDRRTGAPYQCANGDQYGIGMLGRMFADAEPTLGVAGNIYPYQDADSNELRAWLCADVDDSYWGCTTHLSSEGDSTTLAQCQYLMSTVIPELWSTNGRHPSSVGGDLNLEYDGSPDAQDCVPSGWFRKGDGSVQHVMLTDDFTFDFTSEIDLEYSDHPGWLVAAFAP